MYENFITEPLVIIQCLHWMYFNFSQADIEAMREKSEQFDRLWSELLADHPQIITHQQFHAVFFQLEQEGKAAVLSVCIKKYEADARKTVGQVLTP